MRTIIFPGYSLKNKDWAEEVKRCLEPDIPTSIVNWKHWETNETEKGWLEKEAHQFLKNNTEKVNILAKSIGTIVAMNVLKLKPELVNKIILCGVPLNDFQKGDEKYFQVLEAIPPQNFVCFQNKVDNHGSYREVEKFIHSINSQLSVISKPRSDHEYPYPDEFRDFLKK